MEEILRVKDAVDGVPWWKEHRLWYQSSSSLYKKYKALDKTNNFSEPWIPPSENGTDRIDPCKDTE
jgi:hypothetical protein